MKPKVAIIVAMDDKGGIGKDGKIPWHIPEDMRWFKAKTLRKVIVMGRRTHESIGKVLPGRLNVVLTSDMFYKEEVSDLINFTSFGEALDVLRDGSADIMVIGGTQAYKEALPYAERLYITRVEGDFECDTFFPKYNEKEWELVWWENTCNQDHISRFEIYDLEYRDKV